MWIKLTLIGFTMFASPLDEVYLMTVHQRKQDFYLSVPICKLTDVFILIIGT